MKLSVGWVVRGDAGLVRTGSRYVGTTSKVYRTRGTATRIANKFKAKAYEAFIEIPDTEDTIDHL